VNVSSNNSVFIHEKFDWVVGNPPYFLFSSQKSHRGPSKSFHTTHLSPLVLREYKTKYFSWPHDNRNPNVFVLFIERAIQLLKEGGIVGLIIPDIILAGISTWNCRKYILSTCKIRALVSLNSKVFPEGGISNVIIFLEKCKDSDSRTLNEITIIQSSPHEIRVNDERGEFFSFIDSPTKVPQRVFEINPQNVFSVNLNSISIPIFQKIIDKVADGDLIKLKDVCFIHRGIENLSKKKTYSSPLNKESSMQKVIAGENIEEFKIVWDSNSFSGRYIDLDELKDTNVKVKPIEWYTRVKIVIKRVSSKLVAALDSKDQYFVFDSVQMLWIKPEYENQYRLETILAILNSEFLNFYYKSMYSYKRLFARVQKIFLGELPLPRLIPMAKQDHISSLVMKIHNKSKKKTREIIGELNQIINHLYFSDPLVIQKLTEILTLPISLLEIPGLGPRAYYQLAMEGIKTIDDLLTIEPPELAEKLGNIHVQHIAKWQKLGQELVKKKFHS
jgi:hypothetical protein